MNILKTSGYLVLLTSLAACGGDSDSIGNLSAEEMEALATRADAASIADPEDLEGTATMSGAMILAVDEGESVIIGNMDMTADFTESEISGGATAFNEYEVVGECSSIATCDVELLGSIGGELVLLGDIEGSDFFGSLDGEVTGSEEITVEEETFTVSFVGDVELDVEGAFLQDDAGLLAAATLDGGAIVEVYVDGEFEEEDEISLFGGFVVAE